MILAFEREIVAKEDALPICCPESGEKMRQALYVLSVDFDQSEALFIFTFYINMFMY